MDDQVPPVIDYGMPPKRDPLWFRWLVIAGIILALLIIILIVATSIL